MPKEDCRTVDFHLFWRSEEVLGQKEMDNAFITMYCIVVEIAWQWA